MAEPDGYRVPLCRALTEQVTLGGIPRNGAYGLWGIVCMFAVPQMQLWLLPIGLGFHCAWALFMKMDPQFDAVMWGALRYVPFFNGKQRYEA